MRRRRVSALGGVTDACDDMDRRNGNMHPVEFYQDSIEE